jgi:glutamine cyclotransferase
MIYLKNTIIIICGMLFFLSCKNEDAKTEKVSILSEIKNPIAQIQYSVTNKYPHDISSFTEGLLFHNNTLFESTGSPSNLPQTKSVFGPVDLKTGKINVKVELDKTIYFGEGLVFIKNKICQITYTNQIGFVYDAKTFKKINQFSFTNKEGWGLTTDGTYIIMSDGTFNLSYLNADDYSLVKNLSVTDAGYGLDNLNELEYINGFIYANVWTTQTIVKINPSNGEVVGKIDISALFDEAKKINPSIAETNGIAYDSINNKILVTGKFWPKIYEIDFAH